MLLLLYLLSVFCCFFFKPGHFLCPPCGTQHEHKSNQTAQSLIVRGLMKPSKSYRAVADAMRMVSEKELPARFKIFNFHSRYVGQNLKHSLER